MLFHKRKKNYFDEEIEVSCQYCRYGFDFDGAAVCRLGRSRNPDGSCRKFQYDPLKRQPYAPPPLREFDPEDFKL